jgi:hypothetical protein
MRIWIKTITRQDSAEICQLDEMGDLVVCSGEFDDETDASSCGNKPILQSSSECFSVAPALCHFLTAGQYPASGISIYIGAAGSCMARR